MTPDRRAEQAPIDLGEVEERLRAALEQGLDDPPVETDRLARRVAEPPGRGRRGQVSVLVAAVAVAMVPLTYGLTVGRTPAPSGPAATLQAAGTPSSAPTSVPTSASTTAVVPIPKVATSTAGPTQTPATPGPPPASAPSGPAPDPTPWHPLPAGPIGDPNEVAYPVPAAVALAAGQLPQPMQLTAFGDYRMMPTVMGQGCGDSRDPARFPVAGAMFSYAEEQSNRLDQLTVDVDVSGWAPGTGHAHFQDLVRDTGVCRLMGQQHRAAATGLPGDEAWAASTRHNGLASGRAAVRLGDLILAVEVYDARGEAASVKLAKKLLRSVVANARATGLVAQANLPQR